MSYSLQERTELANRQLLEQRSLKEQLEVSLMSAALLYTKKLHRKKAGWTSKIPSIFCVWVWTNLEILFTSIEVFFAQVLRLTDKCRNVKVKLNFKNPSSNNLAATPLRQSFFKFFFSYFSRFIFKPLVYLFRKSPTYKRRWDNCKRNLKLKTVSVAILYYCVKQCVVFRPGFVCMGC